MRVIRGIAVHTAAARGDQTVEEIRAWHVAKGWGDIGYHFVIRKDGQVCPGRPVEQVGAHVYGHNDDTIGVVFTGHGDVEPWTPAQTAAWQHLAPRLMAEFELTPEAIKGHREFPDVHKTCPGLLIDMDVVRSLAARAIQPPVTLTMPAIAAPELVGDKNNHLATDICEAGAAVLKVAAPVMPSPVLQAGVGVAAVALDEGCKVLESWLDKRDEVPAQGEGN